MPAATTAARRAADAIAGRTIADGSFGATVGPTEVEDLTATLRGMVKGDMRETANAVLRLVNEDKRGGVQIDPTAFGTYGINAVNC